MDSLTEVDKGTLRGLIIWIAGEMHMDEEVSPDAMGHRWLAVLKKVLDWDEIEQKSFEEGLRVYIEEMAKEDELASTQVK